MKDKNEQRSVLLFTRRNRTSYPDLSVLSNTSRGWSILFLTTLKIDYKISFIQTSYEIPLYGNNYNQSRMCGKRVGHVWTNFGCFSDPSHTILLPLGTQEHLWVWNDCAKFYVIT